MTTYERLELSLPPVVKKDGRRETFDRNKLLTGIRKACEKRPVSMEQIEATVASIERRIAEQFSREVPTNAIGDLLMEELGKLDPIAWLRFASVYQAFSDVSQFIDALKRIKQQSQ